MLSLQNGCCKSKRTLNRRKYLCGSTLMKPIRGPSYQVFELLCHVLQYLLLPCVSRDFSCFSLRCCNINLCEGVLHFAASCPIQNHSESSVGSSATCCHASVICPSAVWDLLDHTQSVEEAASSRLYCVIS